MDIYMFGSVCRGEVDIGSDVDVLIVLDSGEHHDLDLDKFSIYSHEKIMELWKQGNAFAWHLYDESVLIFSPREVDIIQQLGVPARYDTAISDCERFHRIFNTSKTSLIDDTNSPVFELSNIFLSIRNFAICYSLGMNAPRIYSRDSAVCLGVDSLILESNYDLFRRCRLLSSRGYGTQLTSAEIESAKSCLSLINDWMIRLLEKLKR